MQVLTIAVGLLLFLNGVFAQSSGDWVRLGTSNAELELLVPPQGLLLHEANSSHMALDLKDAWFTVYTRKTSDGKEWVKKLKHSKEAGVSMETKRFGDFLLKIRTSKLEKMYSVHIYAASKTHYYTITSVGTTADEESIRRFLSNVKVGGLNLFPNLSQTKDTVNVTDILIMEQLRMNQVVIDSFSKPDASAKVVRFGQVDEPTKEPEFGYSRRLFVTGKPSAPYTDSARTNNKTGTIRTKVEFRADGTIGAAVIDPKLDRSLAESVAKAVVKIKFVPAEIDGKPVTVTKHVSYSFEIY